MLDFARNLLFAFMLTSSHFQIYAIPWDIIINFSRPSSKMSVIFVRFERKVECFDRFQWQSQTEDFTKFRSLGTAVLCGRTDGLMSRCDEARIWFGRLVFESATKRALYSCHTRFSVSTYYQQMYLSDRFLKSEMKNSTESCCNFLACRFTTPLTLLKFFNFSLMFSASNQSLVKFQRRNFCVTLLGQFDLQSHWPLKKPTLRKVVLNAFMQDCLVQH